MKQVIQHRNLCIVGRYLSTWGLTIFIEHYINCNKCKAMKNDHMIQRLKNRKQKPINRKYIVDIRKYNIDKPIKFDKWETT